MAKKNNFFNLYLRVNDKDAKNTINNVSKDLRALYAYRGNLDPKLDKKKWDEASRKIEDIKKQKQDLIKQTKLYGDAADQSANSLKDFAGNAQEAFSSLMSGDLIGFQEGMMGVRAGIMGATKAAWGFVATPLGAAIAALAGIALATREWFQYNKEALEANRITQQLTQLTGEALDQARIRAVAIEKTFGTDFKESLTAAQSLVKAFGISYEEAFDRIEDGLVRGGMENSEFLDSIKEYPKLFSQAGFTAEEFQHILNTGIDLGIYSDKLPDAIKEFSLSITEATKTSRDALINAFGQQFTDRLFQNIQNGSITSKEALQLVAEEAENIGLNAQQAQQLTADLFRGAGEDAGGALVIFEAVNRSLGDQVRALTPLEAQLNKVAEANRRLEQAQNDALKSDQYAAFMNDIDVAWINFKAGFFEGVNGIMEGLIDVDTSFRKFIFQSVQTVKDAFSSDLSLMELWEKKGAEFDRKQKEREETQRKIREKREQEQQKQKDPSNANFKPSYTPGKSSGSSGGKEEEESIDDEAAKEAARKIAIQEKVAEQLKAWEEDRKLKAQLEKFEEDQKAEEEEILKLERKFEKLEEQAEGEKELLARLEEEKQMQLQDVRDKYSEIRLQKKIEDDKKLAEEERKFKEKLMEAELNLQYAKEDALRYGVAALKGFFDEASVVYKTLLALEKAMAINEVIVNASSAIAQAKANHAAVPPFIGTVPNPVWGLSAAALAKNILATKISAGTQIASIAATTLQGFSDGGYTDMFGMGYKDTSGHEVAGVVHKNEYVVPEIVRRDPEVPQILDYLESKRKKALNLYADGGDTGSGMSTTGNTPTATDPKLAYVLNRLADKMEEPLVVEMLFGYEAEQKRQRMQDKLKKIKDRSKLKS